MPEERGTATDLEPRFYPNLIGRLYLISLEDVMGRNGVNALLNLSGARTWSIAIRPPISNASFRSPS